MPKKTTSKVSSIAENLHPDVQRWVPQRVSAAACFPLGLGETGVHEVCEANFGDLPALTGFVLSAAKPKRGAIAWVSQRRIALEHGACLPAGVAQMCRKHLDVIGIETSKLTDALWTTEEVVHSAAVGCVIAEIDQIDFTASRRLALASSRRGVPVILLLPYTCEGATAAIARWRVSPRPSAPNAYDARAPGHIRWRAVLERARQAPHMSGKVFDLELNDETLSLSVVSGLAAHAVAPHAPRTAERHSADFRKRA